MSWLLFLMWPVLWVVADSLWKRVWEHPKHKDRDLWKKEMYVRLWLGVWGLAYVGAYGLLLAIHRLH